MSIVRDDTARARYRRRPYAAVAPVRVGGPLASGLGAVLVAIVVAVWLALPGPAVAAVATATVVAAAVIIRRTLGSLLAGAGLRLARPYSPGERIRLYVPSRDTVLDAEIVRVGPANTTLMIAGGLAVVANGWLLRSAPDRPASSAA